MSSTKKSTSKKSTTATTQDATTQDATFTLNVDPAAPRSWEQIKQEISDAGITMNETRLISPASLKRVGMEDLRTIFQILTGSTITSDSVSYVATQVAQNATFAIAGADPAIAARLKGSASRVSEETARLGSFLLPLETAHFMNALLHGINPSKNRSAAKRDFAEMLHTGDLEVLVKLIERTRETFADDDASKLEDGDRF